MLLCLKRSDRVVWTAGRLKLNHKGHDPVQLLEVKILKDTRKTLEVKPKLFLTLFLDQSEVTKFFLAVHAHEPFQREM